MLPKKLFKWAKQNGFAYPEELERAVAQPGTGNKVEASSMSTSDPEEIDTRALHTLYKLTLGLAQKHHGLDFSGPRATAELLRASVIYFGGTPFKVTDKTVGKHLKAARIGRE